MSAIERLLWDRTGARRIPAAAAFDRTATALPRGALEHLCEFNPWSPIYLIPTQPFLRGLARVIREIGARRVLEVAAGDGHLARSLAQVAPDLRISATDSGAWERPQARMNEDPLLARIARAAPVLLEIGSGGGVTGAVLRRPHCRLDDLEALARCRLDERPRSKLHTRVTLFD